MDIIAVSNMVSIWIVIVALYLLPTLIASARGHNNGTAVFMLNLFLGWTFLFWVIALVWACTDNVSEKSGV